jgi:long-chain acyl-CoA synthetase
MVTAPNTSLPNVWSPWWCVLTRVRAGVAFLSAQMYERFGRIAAGLAAPPQVVVFGDGELLASGPADDDGELPGTGPYDPDEPAAMHFTSGTTGMPKAVLLSQRNVTANAAQVADALQIDAESVCVICFPTYHPMHMNGTVIAAATQVLTTDPDLTTAVRLANQARATHMFSLPAWLNRLASYSGPDEVRLDTVRFVGSGGAALNPVVAAGRRPHPERAEPRVHGAHHRPGRGLRLRPGPVLDRHGRGAGR